MLSMAERYNYEYSTFIGNQWSKTHVCVYSGHDFRVVGMRLSEVRTVLSVQSRSVPCHVVKQYFSDWSLNLLT